MYLFYLLLFVCLVIYSLAQFLNFSWHYGEHYGAYHYRGDTTLGCDDRHVTKLE